VAACWCRVAGTPPGRAVRGATCHGWPRRSSRGAKRCRADSSPEWPGHGYHAVRTIAVFLTALPIHRVRL